MELKLNLTNLKFFYDAAMMGSVTESARRNFVTQSAISQAISKLERDLGVPLCHHKKQSFKLTEDGELVCDQAKEIFSSVRTLFDKIDRRKSHPTMPINFVCTNSIGLSILPDFLPKFEKKYSNIKVHFHFGGISQIKGWLKQGIAEFALVLDSPEFYSFNRHQVYSGHFCIVKNKKEKNDPNEKGIYVEHTDGLFVPQLLNEIHFPIRSELNSWELIARSISQGGGFGFLPDFVLLGHRYPDLMHMIKKFPHFPYSICAISPSNEELSYSATTFLNELCSNLKKSKF